MNIKFFTTKNFKGMTANVLLSAGIILLILFFAKDNVPELISTGFDKFYLVEDSGVTFYCFDSVSVCYLLLAFVLGFLLPVGWLLFSLMFLFAFALKKSRKDNKDQE